MWKNIKGYEGRYQLNKNGDVKSLKRLVGNGGGGKRLVKTRLLKKGKIKAGYVMVYLRKEGKGRFLTLHRLLAKHFIDNPKKHPCVLHKDGNNQNNRLSNLYWGTQSQNMRDSLSHGTHSSFKLKGVPNVSAQGEKSRNAKLNDKQVRVINYLFKINPKRKQAVVARLFNVSRSTISLILKGKTWKHINI